MEELRKNRLFRHMDQMDKALITMLDHYKNYSNQKKPSICVLCSDNKLRLEVDKAFTGRQDFCVDVVVTSEEVQEMEAYKAMLCDALVICTRAKNIAPKGLYDMVKHIARLDKQIYVVLAGWESMERSEKMAKTRAERVCVEFEFARIMDVINVFHLPCEGYVAWDEAFDTLALRFTERFDALHQNQDENIYQYLSNYVEKFYTKARTEINEELAILHKAQIIAMAKEDYYGIRFSNLAVSIQDVVEHIKQTLEAVTYYDMIDAENNKTLTEIYLESGAEAQSVAKRFLIQEYQRRVELLKNDSNEAVRADNERCVEECINEMDVWVHEISKLKYISENQVERLKEVCGKRTEFEKIVMRYEASVNKFIDSVIEGIPAKVEACWGEVSYLVRTRDTCKEAVELTQNALRKRLSEEKKKTEILKREDTIIFPSEVVPKENHQNTQQKAASADEEKTDETDTAFLLNQFQTGIEQQIIYSRYTCGELVQNCARMIKQDLEKFVASVLKIYFDSVVKEAEVLRVELGKILEEYYLE